MAREGRNDLAGPAMKLCPAVGEVLRALREAPAEIVRMSGSGATCFALFRRHDVMLESALRLAADHPGWWQMSGRLR
jgi:4-diphosphocytidyl-2-C-methyl-D-erythritol kinase